MSDILGFVDTEKATQVVNIVEVLLGSQILRTAFKDVYQALVYPMVEGMVGELANLEAIDNADIIADFDALIEILRSALDFGAIDVVKGEAIRFDRVEEVQTIVRKLFGLNILNAKIEEIIDYVADMITFVDLSTIDASALDLAADGELFALAYEKLAVVLTHDAFPIKDISFSFSLDIDSLLDAYVNETTIEQVLDALRYLSDMSILREALPIALDFAKDLVPADFTFIVEYDGLTKADLIADVKSVVEVLQK